MDCRTEGTTEASTSSGKKIRRESREMPHRANTPVCVCAHMHACLIETLTKKARNVISISDKANMVLFRGSLCNDINYDVSIHS